MSPYIIGNGQLNLIVKTKNTDTKFRIEVLAPKNTRSQLYSFSEKPSRKGARDFIEIPLSAFTPSNDSPNTFSIAIETNGDSASTLAFPSAGVYPVAVSQVAIGDKVSADQEANFSYVSHVTSVNEAGSAYSEKLNLVALSHFYKLFDRTKTFDSNKNLTKYGESTLKIFEQAKASFNSISNLGFSNSILLNGDSFDGYSFLTNKSRGELFDSDVAPNNEYLIDTYVPGNLAELEKQGSTRSFAGLLTSSFDRVNQAGFNSNSKTLITQSLTKENFDTIKQTGFENVVVDERTFSDALRFGSRYGTIKNRNETLKVATYASEISENIPKSFSSSAKANYLIAASSVVALEAPSTKRGLILPIDMSLLDKTTISQFLFGINSSPLVKPITLDEYFKVLQEDSGLSKRLVRATFPVNTLDGYGEDELSEIQKFSKATMSIFEPDTGEYQTAKWMEKTVFLKQDLNPKKYVSKEKSEQLTLSVGNYLTLPKKRTLTITSRQSKIPVTIKSSSDSDISIVVKISGDKLSFPEGSTFEIVLDQQNNTIQIPVKTRTSGSFAISISVLSPENSVEVARQKATVRSTVVSGSGLFIGIGSLLFLALWWISHARKSSKKPVAPIVELNRRNEGGK